MAIRFGTSLSLLRLFNPPCIQRDPLTGTSSPPSSTSTLSGRRRWQARGRSVYRVSGGTHWRLSPAGTRSVPDVPDAPAYSI